MRNWRFVILLTLVGCFKTGEENTDSACLADLEARTVNYSVDIAPVIQQNCENCHGASPNAGRANLNSANCLQNNIGCVHVNGSFNFTYDNLLSYLNLGLNETAHMPPNRQLGACEKFALFKWKEDGFQ